jgi:tRNA(adenine34) deaminase
VGGHERRRHRLANRVSSSRAGRIVDVTHDEGMRLALDEASKARAADEVPVGAVVLLDGRVIGAGFNQPISATDPTAHAEIVAVRAAARAAGNYRLSGSILYVTVEPCLMCVGALIHARVAHVVFGALEPKAGALVSSCRAHETPGLNHRLQVTGSVLEEECRRMIQGFFEDRRARGQPGA